MLINTFNACSLFVSVNSRPVPALENKKKAPVQGMGGSGLQTKLSQYFSQQEQETDLESSGHANSDKERLVKGRILISQLLLFFWPKEW